MRLVALRSFILYLLIAPLSYSETLDEAVRALAWLGASKAESVVDDIGQAYLTNQMDLDTAMTEGKKRINALGS